MRYKYKAFTEKGKEIRDTIVAKDAKTALARLASKSLTVEEIKRDWLGALGEITQISIGGVNMKEKVVFTRNLALMAKAGLTLDESLSILAEQSTNAKLTRILLRVNDRIQSGKTLSEGLAEFPKTFSRLYVSIVSAAERSGTLERSLNYLAEQLSQTYEIRIKVRNALMYPTIVVVTTISVMILLALFVLPKLTALFASFKTTLPWTTRAIIQISDVMTHHTFALIGVIFALIILVPMILRLPILRPITNRVVLRLPLVRRFVRYFNIALFCRTLGTLLVSGVPVNQALEITASTMSNVSYNKVLREVGAMQQTGETLGNLLRQYPLLFSPMVYRMIAVGEESGNLEEVLLFLADFHEKEIDYLSKNLTSVLEPLLLLFVGGAVLVIALAIITPIYSITGNFRF